jgi:hypothetical protein
VPRGGARIGAGRKPKDEALKALHGSRRRTAAALLPPLVPADVPMPVVDPPASLTGPALAVWHELAPFALAARTLTAATAAAFVMLCRAVALERALARSREKGGSNHRGVMQRCEIGLTRFGLAPIGKPVTSPAAPPPDPFTEFDTPPALWSPDAKARE